MTINYKNIDNITKKSLPWFVDSCLESDVNLGNTAEILAFCRYLIICLNKIEKFLEKINDRNIQILDVLAKLKGQI